MTSWTWDCPCPLIFPLLPRVCPLCDTKQEQPQFRRPSARTPALWTIISSFRGSLLGPSTSTLFTATIPSSPSMATPLTQETPMQVERRQAIRALMNDASLTETERAHKIQVRCNNLFFLAFKKNSIAGTLCIAKAAEHDRGNTRAQRYAVLHPALFIRLFFFFFLRAIQLWGPMKNCFLSQPSRTFYTLTRTSRPTSEAASTTNRCARSSRRAAASGSPAVSATTPSTTTRSTGTRSRL